MFHGKSVGMLNILPALCGHRRKHVHMRCVGIRVHLAGQEARLHGQQAEGVNGGRVAHGLGAHGLHAAADGQPPVTQGIDGTFFFARNGNQRILPQHLDGCDGIGGFASLGYSHHQRPARPNDGHLGGAVHRYIHTHGTAHVHAGRAGGIVGAAAGDDVHMIRLHLLVKGQEVLQILLTVVEDLLHGFRLQENVIHHGHILIHLLSLLHGPQPLY